MNIPNIITLARTLLAFAGIVMLCFDSVPFMATAAFFTYVIAGVSDFFDGYIARRCGIVTTFGKYMDSLCDKIMVVAFFMALFAFGMFGDFTIAALFCAIISITREFAVSGIRMIASVKGVVIAAEIVGKYKSAFQMYSLGAFICARAVALDFPPSFSPLEAFAYWSGVATLVLSTFLSVCSGVGYAIKYSNLLKE